MSAPAVAVSADGKKLVAAWKDVRSGEPNVYWTASTTGSFENDAPVHGSLTGEQNHPSMTIDEVGTTWIAWEDRRTSAQRIWVRSSAPGDTERAVSSESDTKAGFPAVASGGGIVAVAYEARRDGKDAVVFRMLK